LRRISTLRSTTHLPNHTIPTLRQYPPSSSAPPPTFPFLNPDVVPPRPSYEESSPAGKLFKFTWPTNPRNILIIKKRRDEKVTDAAITFARYAPPYSMDRVDGRHVHEEYPVNIIVEPGVANEVQDRLPFTFTPPMNGELR